LILTWVAFQFSGKSHRSFSFSEGKSSEISVKDGMKKHWKKSAQAPPGGGVNNAHLKHGGNHEGSKLKKKGDVKKNIRVDAQK